MQGAGADGQTSPGFTNAGSGLAWAGMFGEHTRDVAGVAPREGQMLYHVAQTGSESSTAPGQCKLSKGGWARAFGPATVAAAPRDGKTPSRAPRGVPGRQEEAAETPARGDTGAKREACGRHLPSENACEVCRISVLRD